MKFDTKDWTQEQINMIQAMAVSVLAKRGVNYDSIKGVDGELTIENPSEEVSLTEQDILDEYGIWKAENDTLEAQTRQEEEVKLAIIEQAKQATTKLELQEAVNKLLEVI